MNTVSKSSVAVKGWYSSPNRTGVNIAFPYLARLGLFDIFVGYMNFGFGFSGYGAALSNITFRPVILN